MKMRYIHFKCESYLFRMLVPKSKIFDMIYMEMLISVLVAPVLMVRASWLRNQI